MDIKLLEDFVCLAAQESFTAAARERNVTQSALSRRVRSLEGWLGTVLINRNSKTFALTPQGRIFLSEADVILRRLYNAREAARVLGANGDFEIAVASQNSIAQTLFPDWVKRLESRLDGVYVRLISEKLSECIELLNQDRVDYMFCYAHDSSNLPIDGSRFTYTTIGKDSLIPVTVPAEDGSPLFSLPGSPDKPLPFVAYVHDSVFGKAVDRMTQGKSHQCYLARRYENAYSHSLKSLVTEKLGLAWLPESSITADLADGRLCRAGDEHWNIEFDIRLYYHHVPSSAREHTILETSLEMAANLSD
ncbi:MAG TPA: LysR family transcriptional regulator [Pirellulales bacterium]|jgi:DNA-binding transcriptional LysR family regulator|nr:LysR family transcriptional regulator [Pirellulales bacterium]